MPVETSRPSVAGSAFLALSCVGFVASAPAQAQEQQRTLGGVTVTDTAIDADSPRVERASSPRLTEPLRDTPRTISVLPEVLLDRQNAVDFQSALRNVPGITLGVGEGGAGSGDFITMRGFDASSDVTIDGFADRLQYTRSDLFNVEQLEVYKGPSSALSGSGGAAGQINLVSKAPQSGMFVRGDASLGTDGYKRATADVNVPVSGLGGGAFRLNVMAHDQDVARRDEIYRKRYGFAPSFAIGLDGPTRATISYMYQDDDNLIDYGIPMNVDGTPLPIRQSNFYGVANADTEQQTIQLATLKIEHDFNDAVSLSNTARWGKVTRLAIWSTPQNRNTVGEPGECAPNPDCTFASAAQAIIDGRYDEAIFKTAGPQGIGRDIENEVLMNQLNLTAHIDTGAISHALVVGTEFGREKFTRGTVRAGGLSGRLVNLYAPEPNFAGPITFTETPGEYDHKASRFAVYAFDTVKLNDQFHLNFGGRWERFKAVLGGTAVTAETQTDKLFTWQAGAVYKPVETGSIYVSYANAKQPQALAATATGSGGTALNPPLKNRSFEIGTKWDVLGDALSLAAALFRTERTNEAIANTEGDTEFNGKRRVQGLELSAVGKLSEAWSVYAAYSYMDSKIVRAAGTPAGQLTEGESLTQTPPHNFTIWTDYQAPFGLTVGGGVNYVGSRTARNSNLAPPIDAWKFDDYILVNAMASYDIAENIALQVNVQNLFNQKYFERPRVTNSYAFAVPGEGRSAVASLRFTY